MATNLPDLSPDQWAQSRALFEEAVVLPSNKWTSYLREHSADPLVRETVAALLEADAAPRVLLDASPRDLSVLLTGDEGRPGLLPGDLLDRYRIEREIGQGGMATVYLAHDQKHDREVALKVLQPDLALALRTERFVREIQIAARLTHPHIVPLHDSGEVGGIVYYVMPYVEGESLRDRLRREKQLPVEDALRIGRDVAAALSHAHSHGVVHRDIKPENILLAPGGEAVVVDFGIARALTVAGGQRASETGVIAGTPAYMSPEQSSGAGELDGRSDIYSLGCVLYEMLAGHPPFSAATAQDVISRHASDPIPALEGARPGVASSVARAVRKALAKQPVDRFATADQFAAALTVPAVAGPRVRWLAYALGVVVLVAGGVLTRQALVPTPATAPAAPSVAVLPFVNLTGDSANDYLTDGFSEELIGTLAQIPSLRVPASTSSFHFKGKALPAHQIGESLGVANVVEASLRQEGSRLRITAQLVRVADASNLWSASYDRELAGPQDVLMVQEEVARAIAQALEVTLVLPAAQRPASPEAYELYLKGRFLWNRGTEEGLTQALRFFSDAIAKDSGYARAYAGLADTYIVLWVQEYLPRSEAYPKARAAAQRAVALDSLLPEAYASRGRLRTLEWNWLGADQDLRRAVTLSPGDALAHRWYAITLTRRGRTAESLREASRALELDPLSAQVQATYAEALLYARQYDRAIEQYRMLQELEPRRPQSHQRLALAYVLQNRVTDALREFQVTLDLLGGRGRTSFTLAELGYAYARFGRRHDALRILEELKTRLARGDPVTRPVHLAILCAGLGEADEAFAWLAKAYEERDNLLTILRVYPVFDPLRSDPRFNELLRNVGL